MLVDSSMADDATKIVAAIQELFTQQTLQQMELFGQFREELAAWTRQQDAKLDRHSKAIEQMVSPFAAGPLLGEGDIEHLEGKNVRESQATGRVSSARDKQPEVGVSNTNISSGEGNTDLAHLKKQYSIDRKNREKVMSSMFDHVSAAVIVANSAWLGLRVQLSYGAKSTTKRFEDFFLATDIAFAAFFLLELSVRIWAHGHKAFFYGSAEQGWNRFDTFIVFATTGDMVLEHVLGRSKTGISILRVARIVRIFRVVRVFRVMKFFRALKIMIDAISITLKTGFWAFVLWLLMTYLAAVAISQSAAEYLRDFADPKSAEPRTWYYFGNLGSTCITLWMSISGGTSWESALDELWKVDGVSWIVFNAYIVCTVFCMVNVMTGIFCQNAIDVFEQDKDNQIEARLSEKDRLVETLQDIFNQWDVSGDGVVSREEFYNNLCHANVQALLTSLDVDTRKARELFDVLDIEGDGHLDLEEFLMGCIKLRGNAKAVHMEKVFVQLRTLQENVHRQQAQISSFVGHLVHIKTSLADLSRPPFSSLEAERSFEIESAIEKMSMSRD